MKTYVIKSCKYPFKNHLIRQPMPSTSNLEETLASRFKLKLGYFQLKRDHNKPGVLLGYYFDDLVIELTDGDSDFSFKNHILK